LEALSLAGFFIQTDAGTLIHGGDFFVIGSLNRVISTWWGPEGGRRVGDTISGVHIGLRDHIGCGCLNNLTWRKFTFSGDVGVIPVKLDSGQAVHLVINGDITQGHVTKVGYRKGVGNRLVSFPTVLLVGGLVQPDLSLAAGAQGFR